MNIGTRIGGLVIRSIVVLAFAAPLRAAEPARQAQPVPLGGSLPDQSGDHYYCVYMPTRFGGELTVTSSSGTVGTITGPDGRPQENGGETGTGRHGWYTFPVTGAQGPYTVETKFVQVGQSARKPWNYYYWPTKSDVIHEPWAGGNARVDTMQAYGDDEMGATPGGYIAPGQDIVRAGPNGILETPVAAGDDLTWFPNMYDDMYFRGATGTIHLVSAPLLKYDQIFNTSARLAEAAKIQNHDIQRWLGHCLGGAVASILLNEPVPAVPGLTVDELKALWCELGENHFNHRIGDNVNNIPAGPPQPGYDECDSSVPRFHRMLETHIRGERKALLANLRAFPPRGTRNEVWNHGVGKYTAEFHAIPGRGARAIQMEVAIEGNSGSSLDGRDTAPRIIRYEYSLVYGIDGNVDQVNTAACDWISVKGEALFAPLNLMEVTSSTWSGHNPYVTEPNVRALDLANGGYAGRFAGIRPFRPARETEGGYAFGGGNVFPQGPYNFPQGPYNGGPYANNGMRTMNYGGGASPGGFFGGFFGR
jgi:hypothetical protein